MNLQETTVWIDGLFPGEMTAVKAGGFHIACLNDAGQFVASTLDFGQVDTGLQAEGRELRVELFAVASDSEGLVELVSATAQMLRDVDITPHPGEVVPGIGEFAPGLSVRHGVLVVPFTWGGEVPHFKDGDVMTLMLQVLPITDDELSYLQTYGLAELQQALVKQGIDVLDLRR